MRVAVLADVHGFSPALATVLEDIKTRDVDQIVAAGDLCAGGPDPDGSIHLLRDHDCVAVFGNTDRDLLDHSLSGDEERDWTRNQLGASELEWLRRLPFSVRIQHPEQNAENSQSDLLVVHANPVDVDRHLSPQASEREILEIIAGEKAETIAFGHLHVAYTRQVGNYTLVDVSAVGSPRDNDLRPRYVIFESSTGSKGWSHKFHFVDYPLDETRAMMEASRMPDWRGAWDRLQQAAYHRQI